MASTQKLTELPTIQYTGMDYSTVIEQIKNIIENNSNWKSNWTQFYSSEAGTMLIQLMAWICDNLAVRQDLLYNESYLSTASSDSSRLKLLKQISYTLKNSVASIVPITITINKPVNSEILITSCEINEKNEIQTIGDVSSIKNNIFSFQAPNVNGENTNWEILHLDDDNNVDYLFPIKLDSGTIEFSSYKENSSSKEYTLKAVQGRTLYKEFGSDTRDGPVFNLGEVDVNNLRVYEKNTNKEHVMVDNFIDITQIKNDTPCFVIERENDGTISIRYPSEELCKNNELLENHLFNIHSNIGVLYRTCSGSVGNVQENYFNVKTSAKSVDGKKVDLVITNLQSGYNGRDAETYENAVKNAPLLLRTLNRAVTTNDYDLILKNNPSVLNCKTFTPDNMPTYFSSYYGREIYPHEVFSMVVLNKNFNNIPNEYLNKYPWIELNKSHAINEKVSFSEHEFNSSVIKNDGVFGLYIADNYSSENSLNNEVKGGKYINGSADDGSIFTEEHDDRFRLLKNATIFKSGSYLQNYVLTEKAEDDYQLKVKLNDEYYSGNTFNVIKNCFFDDDSEYKQTYLKTNKNIFIEDCNATFTSKNSFEKAATEDYNTISKTKINLFDYIDKTNNGNDRPGEIINIVFDDNFTFKLDLRAIVKENIHLVCNEINEKESLSETLDEEQIFRDLNNFYLNVFCDNQEIDKLPNIIENFASDTWTDKIETFFEDQISSNYFYGLVEQINKQYLEQKKITVEAEETNATLELARQNSKYTALPRNNSDIKGEYNGIIYQDLGLQYPYSFDFGKENEIFENEESKQSEGLFYLKVDSTDNISQSNLKEYIGKFYNIKINGNIYKIRIDPYSIKRSWYFYNKLYNNDSSLEDIESNTDYSLSSAFSLCKKTYYKYAGFGEQLLTVEALENIVSLSSNIISKIEGKLSSQATFAGDEHNLRTVNLFWNEKENIGNNGNKCDAIYINNSTLYMYLTSDRLAILLNYIFSPLNFDKEIIYKLKENNDSGKEWVDIHDDDNFEFVMEGCLKVTPVTKKYYNYSGIQYNKYSNSNDEGNINDIRFELVDSNENNLILSSVSEEELLDENKNYPATNISSSYEGNNQTSDFFQNLFGYRKQYSSKRIDDIDKDGDTLKNIAYIFETNDGAEKIRISSLREGKNSSIYIHGNSIAITNSNGSETKINLFSNLLRFNDSSIINVEDGDKYYSQKAFGQRRMEMFAGYTDDEELALCYDNDSKNEENFINSITVGDIVLTDSDINFDNVPDFSYLSYILYEKNSIELKQQNYYYSDDEDSNSSVEVPIVGIEGQVIINETDENGNSYKTIDTDASEFNVRVSNNTVDTNSFYCIEDGDELTENAIRMTSFGLQTLELARQSDGSTNNMFTDSGINSVSIAFSIDTDESSEVSTDNKKIVYVDDIDVTPDNLYASNIYEKIHNALINSENDRYINNANKIIRKLNNNDNVLVFSNISSNNNGCIIFYDTDNTDTLFYKYLFGTNKTNKNFYTLYPKEVIEEINGTNKNIIYTSSDLDEYYYAPYHDNENSTLYNLKFIFRAFTDESRTSSKYADYYITCSGDGFYNSSDDTNGYKFTLVRTDTSILPDGDFYVHFVNDRSYEGNRNTEEDVLNNYMKKYMIAGTSMTYLKPYFKTFDISGNIYYNSNYDLSSVKKNVTNALENKYKITNIENIPIGNKIYLSDVTKLIMDVDGIEHIEITYFGLDAANPSEYPSETKYLSVDEKHEFYTTIVLAETDTSKHGIQLTYQKDSD